MSRDQPRLDALWWAPLAFVVLALVLLAATPMLVERRVEKLRSGTLEPHDHARVLLNDLEAALVSQVLTPAGNPGSVDTAAMSARVHVATDEAQLRRLTLQIGDSAAMRFERLVDLVNEWRRSSGGSTVDTNVTVLAQRIITSAEELDEWLASNAEVQRERVRRIERLNVLLAIVLVPIALVAIGMVGWAGRRVQALAREADAERAAVIRSTNSQAALLRGVTHDVKNPLGAAAGYAQLLEEGLVGPLTEPQVNMVRRIHRLVQMAVETVTDLLELAHAQGGRLTIEHAETDLASLAYDIGEDHQGLAQEHGITVSVEVRPTQLVTDPIRVRQILANLLSNAIKYTPAGGAVTMRIVTEPSRNSATADGRIDQGHIGVEIRDTGRGIPSELRGHLFEEFFRVRSDDEAISGNGLGLAMSRRLARLLGGDVTYAPNEPTGSVFTLWLSIGGPVERAPGDRRQRSLEKPGNSR